MEPTTPPARFGAACPPWFAAVFLMVGTACPGFGDKELADLTPPSETPPTWQDDIEPILAASCGGCHTNPPAGGAPSGFRLDTYATDEAGDGLPGAFEMRARVFSRAVEGEPTAMPPGSPLLDDVRAVIGEWITAGAPETAEDIAE